MKILTVTNMWPIPEHKYFGIFVKEQVEALKLYFPEIENKVWFINGYISKINYLYSLFSINYHLIFNKYDIIHIHFGLSGLFLLLNPFIKVPIITMLHSADIDIDKSNKLFVMISKYVVKRSTKVLILNEKMIEILSGEKDKLIYLPCGVNEQFFLNNRNNQNEIDTLYKIAFPASKDRPEKNYQLFSKIIDQLNIKYGYKIEIIEIHNRSREEVLKILNDIDLLLMTSISEGSPQIIKEALCCNTPIVSSNVGDVTRLMDGVNNCYVIDNYNVDEYVYKIIPILKLSKSQRISNGRDRVYNLGLDSRSTSSKLYEIYSSQI